MGNNWPKVNLGELLTRVKDEISVLDDQAYARLTIRMNGNGIVLRDRVPGHEIGTKRQFLARAGQLVLSKIDARNGAFGILPQECDRAIITGNFWAFDANEERLSPAYFDFLTKTPMFVEFCVQASEGTTNRRYLQEDRFLAQQIPLPMLAEQRRIVTRIEELAAKVQEARVLRKQATEQAKTLTTAFLHSTFDSQQRFKEWPLRPLPEVADVARGKFAHRPRNEPAFYGGNFPFIQIGDISNANRYIRNYSQTLNEKGLAISRSFPTGTVVIAITGATIGVTGILTFDACFPDSIVGIQAKPEFTTPEFIYVAVEHAKKAALAEATQTTQPNINLGNLERLQVRVPPLPEQRRIVAHLDDLQEKTNALKTIQPETAKELDAFMPSILDRAFRGEL